MFFNCHWVQIIFWLQVALFIYHNQQWQKEVNITFNNNFVKDNEGNLYLLFNELQISRSRESKLSK